MTIMSKASGRLRLATVGVLGVALLSSIGLELRAHSANGPALGQQELFTNEQITEDVRSSWLNLNDPMQIFDFVFAKLNPRVTVYPTENYYYFRFFDNQREIWGNIRLDTVDREQGIVSFAYYAGANRPEKIEDTEHTAYHKELGKAQGVELKRLAPLQYEVTYKGKSVVFQLNDLSQRAPENLKMLPDEEFVARTFDESGFQFLLLFDQKHGGFRFVLDESVPLPDLLIEAAPNVVAGRRTGFAFFNDKTRERKVLIGIDADNIRRNNYYDGPFDQLADNFEQPKLKEYMEQAYPYVRGRIEERGVFRDSKGNRLDSRLALTPYQTYNNLDEIRGFVEYSQKKYVGDDAVLLNALTHDYKRDVPGAAAKKQ